MPAIYDIKQDSCDRMIIQRCREAERKRERLRQGGDRMHTKTMEGLIGARTNMNLVNTPMRVYKEARRKGDLGAMERAMGYASDFAGKAEEYKAEADEGMKKEAEEAKEKKKLELEEELEQRREERKEEKEKLEQTDTVELSEEGNVLLKENTDLDGTEPSAVDSNAGKEMVFYTSTGTVSPAQQGANISVSV